MAELSDGRVLVVWRTSGGYKYYSVSDDGGMTLSKPAKWTYDDGSEFTSPCAYHRMIRHSVTGKLYWVGNPGTNPNKRPLVIAEVDETKVALKKSTVTMIDDKGPKDGDRLQLSNFCLLENRQTHELEIYLTRYGEDPNDFWGANAYKYTLTLDGGAKGCKGEPNKSAD